MKKKVLYGIGACLVLIILIGIIASPSDQKNVQSIEQKISEVKAVTTPEVATTTPISIQGTELSSQPVLYSVTSVVDGDTIKVNINGRVETIRLVGINTPETVDPRKSVECFGKEASNRAKALLTGKKVSLEADPTQGERDKYDRLLRYVFLEDGTNFNLSMIKDGYAYEYTYNLPYKYQIQFKQAQKEASDFKAGLWGDMCNGNTTQTDTAPTPNTVQAPATNNSQPVGTQNQCTIKGNINSKKEKIYHVIGCGSYNQTVIDESKGEKWFCSEQEALDAGWRKALNCN